MSKVTLPYKIEHPVSYLGNYINGEFHSATDPNGEWIVQSPACLKDEISKIKYSYADIDRAVDSAETAQKKWKTLRLEDRVSFLKKYQSALKNRESKFIEIISREVGKPIWETKTEFSAMLSKIDITIQDSLPLIKDIQIPNAAPGALGISRYRPHGIMAVIGPFNFPGHLPNGHIVPALITGNAVIFKPSEKTPLTGQLIAECFHEAGLPKGVFNLIQGERETSRRLCMHEKIDGILFTGSYEVGARIKQDTLQQYWKILALEMGGKNASIVWDDADIEHSLYEVLFSAFVTTGQRCSATSRVLVHHSIADEFVEKLHKLTKAFKIGHPFENNFMGPLIDATSVDRFLKFQPIAQREGFETIMRGKILELPYPGHYVTPTICYSKKPDTKNTFKSVYQQTELFSPHLTIQAVTHVDDAIKMVNDVQYGLVTSVFSKSKQTYQQFYEEIDCGLINWNKGTVGASSRLPFGGLKKSGNHQPTALNSVFYCTYPVASLEIDEPKPVDTWAPGLIKI